MPPGDNERTVSINIVAKNLSGDELAKVRRELAGVTAETEKSGRAGRKAAEDVGVLDKAFVRLTAAFTAANLIDGAIRGVVRFGKAAFENASNLADMSARTGIGIEMLQRLKFVAENTGTTIDAFGRAVFMLGARIAESTPEVVSAVRALGLEYQELRRLKPEAQFDLVARALEDMEDPQQRNYIALKLFGKTAQDVLPAIGEGYEKLADQAVVASEKQVKAADAAGDAYARMATNIGTRSTQVAGEIIMAMARSKTVIGLFTRDLLQWETPVKDIPLRLENAGRSVASFTDELATARRELGAMTPDTRAQIVAGRELGVTVEELARTLGLSTGAIRLFETGQKASTKATTEQGKALDSLRDKQADTLQQARAFVEFTKEMGPAGDLPAEIRDGFLKSLKDVEGQFGSLEAAGLGTLRGIFDELLIATGQANLLARAIGSITTGVPAGAFGTSLFTQSGRQALETFPAMDARRAAELAAFGLGPGTGTSLSGFPMGTGVPAGALGTPIGPLAGVSGPSFGANLGTRFFGAGGFSDTLGPNIINAITGGGSVGEAIGASAGQQFGLSLQDTFAQGLKDSLGSKIGGTIASFLPGIGTLVGPLIGKGIGKLGDLLGLGSGGRDMVKDFAAQFGGFDALREKLAELGDEGERLWVSLTQGVGRNNKDEAQRAIEAVTAALDKQEQTIARGVALFGELQGSVVAFGGVAPASMRPFIDELLTSTKLTADQRTMLEALAGEPTWQVQQQKAEQYGIALSALGPQFAQARISDIALGYARDLQFFADVGADASGVLEGMADELSALVTDALASGSALPESLRPWIEKLVDAGLLLGPDGEIRTGIGGLTFEDIEDEPLLQIKSVLEEIRDFLRGDLPDAARQGAQEIRDAYRDPIDVGIRPRFTEEDGLRPDPVAFAHGGIAEGRTLAVLAERGRREIVGSAEFIADAMQLAFSRMGVGTQQAVASGGATGGRVGDLVIENITLNVDGRQFAKLTQSQLSNGEIRVPQRVITTRL